MARPAPGSTTRLHEPAIDVLRGILLAWSRLRTRPVPELIPLRRWTMRRHDLPACRLVAIVLADEHIVSTLVRTGA